jgi:hypothetical protein
LRPRPRTLRCADPKHETAAILEMEEPHDDEPFMTEWESEFVWSVSSQGYPPTYNQQTKLEEIEERIAERREMWRQGWRWLGHWGGR